MAGRVAFVFPGQGSQKTGMGLSVFERFEVAREVFDAADTALEFAISQLCFEGPDADLKLTANTQPALLTTEIALLRAFEREHPEAGCDFAAGHSLGEYAAHVCAGTLPFAEAVKLVRLRGQLMQEAVPIGQGKMMAVLGLQAAEVEALCSEVEGFVATANYNCPGQIVVAGESDAVDALAARIKSANGKAIALPVSAPFHTSMMHRAQEGLMPALRQASWRSPAFPVVANVDASLVTTAEVALATLQQQVSAPVRWEQGVRRLVEQGVRLLVEIGPGRVLRGMAGRIDRDLSCVNIEGPDDFARAAAAIAEAR